MAHFDIEVRLLPVPINVPERGVMQKGDTVRYFSPDGQVRVELERDVTSVGRLVPGDQTVQLTGSGTFECKCFLVPTGQAVELGWSEKTPQAGGIHDVRP